MFFKFQVLHYKVIGFEPGQQVKCTTREREDRKKKKKGIDAEIEE
jgi:hypothetical protein